MKNIAYLLLALVLIQSCDTSISKEKLLTEKKWLLYNEYIRPNPNPDSLRTSFYYKKSEAPVSLIFKDNGYVDIVDRNGESSFSRWYIDKDKKNELVISPDLHNGFYMSAEISERELNISYISRTSSDTKILTFKHFDDIYWTDDKVYNFSE